MAVKEDSAILVMKKFVKACEIGNISEVQRLMNDVSKVNFPRKELETQLRPPMYWACKCGNLEIVRILIEHYPGCDPKYINDAGQNLLFVACARGHVNVARFLYKEYCINPSEPNKSGTTPIFVAAYNGHFDMLNCLIYEMNCDPRSLNSKGESLLHIACEKNRMEIIQYLINEHGLNPKLENYTKKTPLHSACSSGHLGITKYLIEKCGCNSEVFDGAGCTPLHDACRNGHADIVRCFIERKWCNLCLLDNSGCTPLHLSCRFGRKDVVKLLIQQRVDPDIKTATDLTPLQIARDKGVINELIRGGANTSGMKLDIFSDYIQKHPLHPVVKIFIIGHSASGKTTLFTALQQSRRINTHVHSRTAGVIESSSSEFGNALLYDFSGKFEFHTCHAALLRHSTFTSPPLFLLIINLQDTFEESKRQINYWIQFVESHIIIRTSPPHVVVIGSHADLISKVQGSTKFIRLENYVTSQLKSSLLLDGFFVVDCRSLSKQGVFRTCLKQSCDHLRSLQMQVIDPAMHVLRFVLSSHFNNRIACTIQDVIEEESHLDHPLPLQAHRLCDLCEDLSSRTRILFLRNNEDLKRSWIVFDIYALLHDIDYKLLASRGSRIIQWSQLSQEYPDLDPSCLGRLVVSDADISRSNLPLVSQISSDIDDVDDIDKDSPVSTNRFILKEKYIFSPELISPGPPRGLWTSGVFEYYFGWCLRCIDDKQFFSLQFLHTLLLRLSTVSNEQSDCSLWKNGIRWLDLHGIETIVEVVEDCKAVLVLIRMKKGSIVNGIRLRAAVIRKILDTKEEYCNDKTTTESIIDPSHLRPRNGYPIITQPVSDLIQYDIALIATAFCTESKYVHDTKHIHFMEITQLMKFDPYMHFGNGLLQRLHRSEEQGHSLSQDILWDISGRYEKLGCYFEDILDIRLRPPIPMPAQNLCFEVLQRYWDGGPRTLAQFKDKLDMYSLFCGRNIFNCCK